MFKCNKCIFYKENGFNDMGATIPECMLIMLEEKRKKNNNKKYDLFKALILNESQAEECNYFTYTCEAVEIIKNMKDKAD